MKVTEVLPMSEALGNPFLELLAWIIVVLSTFAAIGAMVIAFFRYIKRRDM